MDEGGQSVGFAVTGAEFGHEAGQVQGLADHALPWLSGRLSPFDGEGPVDRLKHIGQTGLEVETVGTAEGDAESGNALIRPGQAFRTTGSAGTGSRPGWDGLSSGRVQAPSTKEVAAGRP